MIEKQTLAKWLYELSRRPTGVSERDYVVQLRSKASDSTWALYLDSINDYLSGGRPYGGVIADTMSIDLDKEVQARLRMSKDSVYVDEILLEASFNLLLNLSDHAKLKSMLDHAEFRYSQHRDYSRGPGPYDIDVFTARTVSSSQHRLAGETINASFTFSDAGKLVGVRSYSMGTAPANPLRSGDEPPDYSAVELEFIPRIAEPLWWLRLTTPVRITQMVVTHKLVRFIQGWAMQADCINLDFEDRIEIRGRARPFQGVELIEIGDGVGDPIAASRMAKADRQTLERILSDRTVKWCLHPTIAQMRQDMFRYNCFLPIRMPRNDQEIEEAKEAFTGARS